MQEDSTVSLSVEIEILGPEDKPNEFLIRIRTGDGSPLTPQQLLDAFSDAVLHEYGHFGKQPLRVHMDS